MKNFPGIGIQVPHFLLPNKDINLQKWSVIACDQYTSQPEYWDDVAKLVEETPSTLNLILPEVYLENPDVNQRILSIQSTMARYLDQDIFTSNEGFLLVERKIGNKIRHGLMLCLDLESYDFNIDSQSPIRATEGTILERLPPRVKIRRGAPLEIPHILVLIDDPQHTVIEPLVRKSSQFPCLYNFDLMFNSGHLTGYLVNDADSEKNIIESLVKLSQKENFHNKYGVDKNKNVLLFAVGDGNHSLATAKAYWEELKPTVGMDHPARYALVEIENVHDAGLQFEPIHRVCFNLKEDITLALTRHFGSLFTRYSCSGFSEMQKTVLDQTGNDQLIGVVNQNNFWVISFHKSSSSLPVGTLQIFLDLWKKQGGYGQLDYVHGDDVLLNLSKKTDQMGFYLPAISKTDLFRSVILDGVLPRKTFSMGESKEKRFYMESRRLT